MKELILFTSILFGIICVQDSKLNGRYIVKFKNETAFQQNGYVDFKNEIFTMKYNNLLPHNGKIKYYKTLTSIEEDNNSNIIIDFRTDEIGKDTINFQVHSRNCGIGNYLDVSINSGKFIRIK